MKIVFETPLLGPEHWNAILEQTKIVIKNSLSTEMRDRYNQISPDLPPEDAFGMMVINGQTWFKSFLVNEEKLPEEISTFLWRCHLGAYEYYAKQNGLVNDNTAKMAK